MKLASTLLIAALFLSSLRIAMASDQRAKSIVRKMAAASLGVQTMTADIEETYGAKGKTTLVMGRIAIRRPNFLRADFWQSDANGHQKRHSRNAPHQILASDGVHFWQIGSDGTMEKQAADKANFVSNNTFSGDMGDPTLFVTMFFGRSGTNDEMPPNMRYVGETRFDGVACRLLIDQEESPDHSQKIEISLMVGPDYIMRRLEIDGPPAIHFVFELRHVRKDIRLSKSQFAFKPPSWAKLQTYAINAPTMHMDEKSGALLEKAAEKMENIDSLTADYTRTEVITQPKSNGGRRSQRRVMGTAKLMRPNFARITYGSYFKGTKGKLETQPPEIHVSNGTTYWNLYDTTNKLYESHKVAEDGKDIRIYESDLLRDFFDVDKSAYSSASEGWNFLTIKYAGFATWQGEKYQTVIEDLIGNDQRETKTLFFGQDGLIHRSLARVDFTDGDTMEIDESLADLKINAPLSKSDFAFTLSAGATEKAEFALDTTAPATTQPALLANGAVAPDFTANDRNGKPVHLSDYKGKVVVVDFWATWCGPCQMSLPNTNSVAEKNPGVVFLAVNVWDSKSAFDNWLPQHRKFSSLKFVIDPTKEQGKDVATTLYHVDGIPTQFVIDPSGKVVKSFVGYDPDTSGLQQAIKSAAKGE